MSKRRTRPAGWLRSASRAAAVLLMAGLLSAPGVGAEGASLFQVSVSTSSAMPGDEVSISFRALDTNLIILSCAAQLGDAPLPDCVGSGGAWSVQFTVPREAMPATTAITWQLRYYSVPDSYLGAGARKGELAFTVLSPSAPPPVSAVLDPLSGRQGTKVLARFTPPDAKSTMTACSVRIAGTPFSDCSPEGTDWVLPFSVPGNAAVGRVPVEWSATYVRGRQTYPDSGVAYFTVLPEDAEPSFTVTVSPESTRTAGSVTLSLSADDPAVSITGCSAQLDRLPLAPCVGAGGAWSIRFTMPKGAAAGRHPITWQLTYSRISLLLDPYSASETGTSNGQASVKVLPPIVTSTPPHDTPSTTGSRRTGKATSGNHTSTGRSGAAPGSVRGAGAQGGPTGAVEPIETASAWVREHSGLGLLLVLICLAALAGMRLGSGRRVGRRPQPNRFDDPTDLGRVRAVAHPGALPLLRVRETGHGHRSRTVRLAAQHPPASYDLKEVTR